MFADGGDRIGYMSESLEYEPTKIELAQTRLKTAVKTEDWRSVIQSLGNLPQPASLSAEEVESVVHLLGKIRSKIETRKKEGGIFSSESLGDLEPELEQSLDAQEKEYNL